MALSFQATMAEEESRNKSRRMETSLRMRLDHVVLQNGDVVLLRESRTLADLSFDGFLALVVGRIAGINNGFHSVNSI